jgi:heptosyltransferase-1
MSGTRILVVKTSSLGDVVHALPLVSDIARARPDAIIDWVVEESFAAIPRLHAAIDQVITLSLRDWRKAPASSATWAGFSAARRALREHVYDAVIDCQGLIKSALIAAMARGPVWGPDRASAREPLASLFYRFPVAVDPSQHAIARNRALGAAAFKYVAGDAPRFSLQVPPLTQPDLVGFSERGAYAVLLTNASRVTKLWPPDCWRAVEGWLAERGLASVLFWGSSAEETETRARAAGMRCAWVASRTSLHQLAALLASARIVIGLDTGLTHLAAAVGAPVIGIFCDYDPALVGVTGAAPCVSLGGVARAPAVSEVTGAAARILDAAKVAR